MGMAARKNSAVDFGDEENVLREVAEELGEDADSLTIKESHMTAFRAGLVWEISTRGGRRSWLVMEDEDAAEALALAVVTQDLEEEPGNFSRDFIEQHIDTDRLRRDLTSDVESMIYDDLREEAERRPERFWKQGEQYGMDVPEEDEDGDLPEPSTSEIEDLAEKIAEDRLADPIAYLEEFYGREDAIEKAIEIAGIDIAAAAQDAVNIDGWPHFLARFNGNYEMTPSGFVVWREN